MIRRLGPFAALLAAAAMILAPVTASATLVQIDPAYNTVKSTVPDGSNVTIGTTTDAACATDNGTCTVEAVLKRLAQRLTTINTTLGSPFQAGGALGAGSAIIGKVGIDQTTPGTTNNVTQDGVLDAATTSASVTSATTVLSLATAGYASGSFQVTSPGTGTTISYEQSNDNATWVTLDTCNTLGSFVTSCINGSSTTAGIYAFSASAAFVRARVSTYGSGTVTVFGTLKRTLGPQGMTVNGGSGNGLVIQGSNGGNALPVWPESVGTQITSASGNVANASAVATLAGAAAKTTYIRGFKCQAAGATAASVVNLTITGTISGTLTYTFVFPAGATVAAAPVGQDFSEIGIAASTTNTAIVVTLPAGGTGNTNASCVAYGYQL